MPDERRAYRTVDKCRSCSNNHLETILGLGEMPLADGLFEKGALRSKEQKFPLTLARCTDCSLVQLLEAVDPTVLFPEDYPYFSSYSDSLIDHSRRHVEELLESQHFDENSLVVEIASNDGYLLQWFARAGIPVLGIDPAPGPAAAAAKRGIETMTEFFDADLARRLANSGVRADLIIANNVLAHVADQNQFVAAISTLLAPQGLVELEFPYLRDLVEKCEFDTIYHEHQCYFSITSVRSLFERHGLYLTSVKRLEIHGGSLRVRFERSRQNVSPEVALMIAQESELGMHESSYYAEFARRVERLKGDLISLMTTLKNEGKRIAAYGAAAKGATLLNFCGIDERYLEYVVDRNVHKQGLEMPGISLPISPPDRLRSEPPEYLLLLAWNFADEIMEQQKWFSEGGGRFVVPVPSPMIV